MGLPTQQNLLEKNMANPKFRRKVSYNETTGHPVAAYVRVGDSVYQIVPLGVVFPKTLDDVRHTLTICTRFGVPLTARGGGTSQAGQSIGPGVIVDFSKYLQSILEINAPERWVRVEPGCVLD